MEVAPGLTGRWPPVSKYDFKTTEVIQRQQVKWLKMHLLQNKIQRKSKKLINLIESKI